MRDQFTRAWILDTGIPIVESYNGNLTIRSLHYRLVAAGMTNSQKHYKRVVAAMVQARWEGMIQFDAFMDHERDVEGETRSAPVILDDEVQYAQDAIKVWMTSYNRNRWENQPYYPEVFIEKKALQGVFADPCRKRRVALCPCKGYPSLTYLHNAAERIKEAAYRGKKPIILYFGDYDPSGEDIPRSIGENLERMGCMDVEVRRIALMEKQVKEWRLPPAPAKSTDSRTAAWDGLGQVELDAVEPNKLKSLLVDAIDEIFDDGLYSDLLDEAEEERGVYQAKLKNFVQSL